MANQFIAAVASTAATFNEKPDTKNIEEVLKYALQMEILGMACNEPYSGDE